jgi:hypothetical protein
VREESHLDDMRAAIRGDFERLAERRGGQELMREPAVGEEPVEEPVAAPAAEPESEPEQAGALPEAEPVPEPLASALPEPVEERLPPEEAPRRSFLDRLLGR